MSSRTWLASVLLLIAGCTNEGVSSPDSDATPVDASEARPAPTLPDRAAASVQRGVGLALEACPGCGPVPDPRNELGGIFESGPVPDPWVPAAPAPPPGPDGKKRP